MATARTEVYTALVDDGDDEHLPEPSPTTTNAEASSVPSRRAQVMTGPLPDDFLQIPGEQAPFPIQQQQMAFGGFHQSAVGILNLTVVQARLAKNYGLTKMDPFCRLRIGVMVFETPTAYNGSKTPRWNKMIQSQLPPGVSDLYIEIYDERTFSMDEKIAWGIINIKDECLEGQTVDEWFPLTGKQGDGKEGMVQVVMQYKQGVAPMVMNPMIGGAPVMLQQQPMPFVGTGGMMYGYQPMMYQQPFIQQRPVMHPQQQLQQQQLQPQHPPGVQPESVGQINEKDLTTLKEMCPDMDEEIIRSVYQQTGGNLDRAAAQLLEMSSS